MRPLTALFAIVCSMLLQLAPPAASAQGLLRTFREALQSNRDVVRANNADAIAARQNNVRLLQQTSPVLGQQLGLHCAPAAIVAPHVQQLVVPQPIVVPQVAPLIQQHFYQPQPLQAPAQPLNVLPQPQAILVPSYQMPQPLVQTFQPQILQHQVQTYASPLGIAQQQVIVPSCRF